MKKLIDYVMDHMLEIAIIFFVFMVAIRFTSSTILSVYSEWHPVVEKCEPMPAIEL